MSKRLSVVNGYFYPNTKEEICELISNFNDNDIKCDFKNIKALIVPHAGYIYSGYTANLAYKLASAYEFQRIIFIGPSHKVAFDGASISTYNTYQTPLKDMQIDTAYVNILKEKFNFTGFNDICHKEHSTETQAPFLAYYFENTKIIEIVYGNIDDKILSTLIDFILKDEKNLLIISTDLSHFHSLKKANQLDKNCINAIQNQNIDELNSCEACGITGIKAFLHVSKNYNLTPKVLNYTTSYERNKDENKVVGYLSVIFGHD